MREISAGAMIALAPGDTCLGSGCELTEARTLAYTEPASALRVMEVVAPEDDGSWPVVVLAHGVAQSASAVRDWATGIATEGVITYHLTWPAGVTRLAARHCRRERCATASRDSRIATAVRALAAHTFMGSTATCPT